MMRTPQRRIDDRLLKLCAKMQAASDGGDVEAVLEEFRDLVRKKIERLQRRAARLLLKGEHLEPERRRQNHTNRL